jgi:hypothetical protein
LRFGARRFGDARNFRAGRRGDLVDVAVVGGDLLGGRLEQVGLQREQLLRVLDRQRGLHVLRGVADRGLGDLEVQLDELLDAFEGGSGEAEQRFDVALLDADVLFNGHHVGSPV